MEAKLQQPESVNNAASEDVVAKEPAPLAMLPPATQSERDNERWRRLGEQIAGFLAQLPNRLSGFFNAYKQLLVSVALIVAAIISVKVILAVLDTINDIPLLAPTFELIGIGYLVWFVNRYLLKESTRQELLRQLQSLKQQVFGYQEFSELER